MLNGRNGDNNPKFTCHKSNGDSVVDYIACDYDTINGCKPLKVISPVEIASKYHGLMGLNCKVPDHSLLSVEFDE